MFIKAKTRKYFMLQGNVFRLKIKKVNTKDLLHIENEISNMS